MITNRSITCINQDGDSITFTEDAFMPFLLTNADDVYDIKNQVNITENTMTDGAVYQGGVAKYRNIVLSLCDLCDFQTIESQDDDIYITSALIRGKTLEIFNSTRRSMYGARDFVEHRILLDKVFKRNEKGRLIFTEDDEQRAIDYYVESVSSTGKNSFRTHVISLICPDPFFYDPVDQNVYLAQQVSDFEFIHEFTAGGEEFGHHAGAYENIYNESANENIGLTIAISGSTSIVNPMIKRMESGDFIQIGDENNPFTLSVGDLLVITTGVGNKHVYLISGDTRTEINYKMADGSSFIQLMRGNNNIAYDADQGQNGMSIHITYRLQYARA